MALVDAELVINLKKPWSKGYFRKAKALVGLNSLEEARQAILDGLVFEPENQVCHVDCYVIHCGSLFGSGPRRNTSRYRTRHAIK
jgi:hypothetical protein